jgi:hypothetical protein
MQNTNSHKLGQGSIFIAFGNTLKANYIPDKVKS